MQPHILLTTDLSEESLRAFGPAADIATAVNAKITLLHVAVHAPIAAPVGEVVPSARIPVDQQKAAERARELLVEFRSRLPEDVPVETTVIRAVSAGDAITEWAREHDVDYVAMATHGRSGIGRVLMGSIAETVLRRAGKPMLLYPKPE